MIQTPNGDFNPDASPFMGRKWERGQNGVSVQQSRDGKTSWVGVMPESQVTLDGVGDQAGGRGPTGAVGPTGAASTVPGPTGPTGPASTVPGPTGPAGGVGPTGPKGSFVKIPSGVVELACAEGTRPYFFHIRGTQESIPPAFIEAVIGDIIRFPSGDGRYELCFAVRREFPNWFMPRSNEKQMEHSLKFWNSEYLPPEQRGPSA